MTEVRLISQPRSAVVVLTGRAGPLHLCLKDPRPLAAMCAALDDCWQVRVFSRNEEDNGQLEFGRYRVEFWDEDCCRATVECDAYELLDETAAAAFASEVSRR